ncbi:MAG: hypothetical protein HRT45_16800 [Bdellovibrionales bacterium]|nr:hypothetical protein [Bdellovibrionales bacterium]
MKSQVISKFVLVFALVFGAQAFGLADSHFDFRNVSGETPMTADDAAYLVKTAQLVGGTVGANLRLDVQAGSDQALDELRMIHKGEIPPNGGTVIHCGIPCTGEKRGQK